MATFINLLRELVRKLNPRPTAMNQRRMKGENSVLLNNFSIISIDRLHAIITTQPSKVRFPRKKIYMANVIWIPEDQINQLGPADFADHHATQRGQIVEVKTNIVLPENIHGHTVPPRYDTQITAD